MIFGVIVAGGVGARLGGGYAETVFEAGGPADYHAYFKRFFKVF